MLFAGLIFAAKGDICVHCFVLWWFWHILRTNIDFVDFNFQT